MAVPPLAGQEVAAQGRVPSARPLLSAGSSFGRRRSAARSIKYAEGVTAEGDFAAVGDDLFGSDGVVPGIDDFASDEALMQGLFEN